MKQYYVKMSCIIIYIWGVITITLHISSYILSTLLLLYVLVCLILFLITKNYLDSYCSVTETSPFIQNMKGI